jgi:hypothetical protein
MIIYDLSTYSITGKCCTLKILRSKLFLFFFKYHAADLKIVAVSSSRRFGVLYKYIYSGICRLGIVSR